MPAILTPLLFFKEKGGNECFKQHKIFRLSPGLDRRSEARFLIKTIYLVKKFLVAIVKNTFFEQTHL